jgi:hypothetical protein
MLICDLLRLVVKPVVLVALLRPLESPLGDFPTTLLGQAPVLLV